MVVTAYILITVPAKKSGNIVEELKNYDAVKEACAVYGETDVIAKVEAEKMEEIDKIVMENIQGLSEVKTTRTFIGVEDMHWMRP
nr:Lrp/AsnC ligand binding domain-containing protein [uncultured Methanoregula sp.]